jgi:DNA-binding MarR family transcriptional regulator
MGPQNEQHVHPGQAALDGAAFERHAHDAVRELAPESDLAAMGVVMNLLRTANRLQQDFETNVNRPAGLSFAAFRVLFAINAAGQLSPLQIARLSNVSAASISSMLNTLERHGLITRRKGSGPDRRMVTVRLTPEGSSLLAALWKRNHQREVQWARALTRAEQRTIARLLRKLLDHHPPATAAEVRRLVPWPGEDDDERVA